MEAECSISSTSHVAARASHSLVLSYHNTGPCSACGGGDRLALELLDTAEKKQRRSNHGSEQSG